MTRISLLSALTGSLLDIGYALLLVRTGSRSRQTSVIQRSTSFTLFSTLRDGAERVPASTALAWRIPSSRSQLLIGIIVVARRVRRCQRRDVRLARAKVRIHAVQGLLLFGIGTFWTDAYGSAELLVSMVPSGLHASEPLHSPLNTDILLPAPSACPASAASAASLAAMALLCFRFSHHQTRMRPMMVRTTPQMHIDTTRSVLWKIQLRAGKKMNQSALC